MGASTAQRAATAARRAQAIALRLAGLDFQTIADRLGYASRAAAAVDINRALESSLAEQHRDAEVWRHELVLGLQRIKAAMWAAAVAGDPKAADVVVKVYDRLTKLTVPQRVEVLTMGAIEAEIARLAAELGYAAGGEVVPAEYVMGHPETGPAA
jgi:hypothetical protein